MNIDTSPSSQSPHDLASVEPEDEILPVDGMLEQTMSGDLDDKKNPGGVEKYFGAVGRRKSATARTRLYTKKSTDIQKDENRALITVNGKSYTEYFPLSRLQSVVEAPLKKLKSINRFKASSVVSGGGLSAQADAVKFSLSRALVLFDQNFSKKLRRSGYLTSDSRIKERRKYGLKKARKSPQWSKR